MSSDSEGTKDIKRWNPETARKGPGTPAVTHKPSPRGNVVRPFTYRDGQAREGTPAGRENTSARTQHYTHPEQEAHRRGLGSQPYPGKR
jgi:hypothetical protein